MGIFFPLFETILQPAAMAGAALSKRNNALLQIDRFPDKHLSHNGTARRAPKGLLKTSLSGVLYGRSLCKYMSRFNLMFSSKECYRINSGRVLTLKKAVVLSSLMLWPLFASSDFISPTAAETPPAVMTAPKTPELGEASHHLVETAYKRYSLYRHQNVEVLCESYTVKKGDWIYQIFRSKGELSEKDFPFFLEIFKKINPDIGNLDHIQPGQVIRIPLKRTDLHDFNQSIPGVVDVPIIKLSGLPDNLNAFATPHVVEKGDQVSDLIHPDFLTRFKEISPKGVFAFKLVNPDIEAIDLIFEGSTIYLPDPSILAQPWFDSLMKKGEPLQQKTDPSFSPSDGEYHKKLFSTPLSTEPSPIPSQSTQSESPSPFKHKRSLKKSSQKGNGDPQNKLPSMKSEDLTKVAPETSLPEPTSPTLPFDVDRLAQFTRHHGGRLMAKGTYFFPANKGKDIMVDLASTPMIRLYNGTRILIVPDKKQYADMIRRLAGMLHHPVRTLDFEEVSALLQRNELMTSPARRSLPKKQEFLESDLSSTFKNLPGKEQPLSASHHTQQNAGKIQSVSGSSSSPTKKDGKGSYIPISRKLPKYHKSMVANLLQASGYPYIANSEIKLPIDQIEIPVSVGRIVRSAQPDIILIFGNVYGSALDAFKKRDKNQVVTVSPQINPYDMIQRLFSELGAVVNPNPSFVSKQIRKTISIPGIFIDTPHQDIFISKTPLMLKEAFDYLNEKRIHILSIQ